MPGKGERRTQLYWEQFRARRLVVDTKTALGNKFSLKDFHNMVLDTGIVPLEILERQTDAFFTRVGGSRP